MIGPLLSVAASVTTAVPFSATDGAAVEVKAGPARSAVWTVPVVKAATDPLVPLPLPALSMTSVLPFRSSRSVPSPLTPVTVMSHVVPLPDTEATVPDALPVAVRMKSSVVRFATVSENTTR